MGYNTCCEDYEPLGKITVGRMTVGNCGITVGNCGITVRNCGITVERLQ